MICDEINALVRYGLEKGLIEAADEIWARNRILDILGPREKRPERAWRRS